jgi:hypothetical protein
MASYRLVPRHRRATPEEERAMRLGIGAWAWAGWVGGGLRPQKML